MQSSVLQRPGSLARRHGAARRAFTPATGGVSRARSVQVFAKKGKNKGVIRQSAGVTGASGMMGPGQAQQTMSAPVPEVDPEQAEFVLFVKGLGVPAGRGSLTVDTPWYPLSIMKAGQGGTTLASFMENKWGSMLYSNVLIRNIAQSIYKEKETIAMQLRKNYPPMQNITTKQLRFAFKIRDKSQPEAWRIADNVTELPPEVEVMGNPFDGVKAFFSPDNLASMFK